MNVRRRRALAWVPAVLAMLVLSSCVLREGEHYVIQPAARGVHVTLRAGTSRLLEAVSDSIAKGNPINGALRDNGYDLRCDHYANSQTYGDWCAFQLVQRTEVGGGLVEDTLSRLYWNAAIDDSELTDFRNDSMAKLRTYDGSCLHVTIQNVGEWPFEWRAANWTYRRASDSKC